MLLFPPLADPIVILNKGIDVQWLARLMKRAHHDSKPEEMTEVQYESPVGKGENYSSSITRVEMRTISASGSRKTVSVIVKTNSIPPAAAELMAEFQQFQGEIEEQNFVVVNRKDWQGLDHAYLVLRSLGRFHAMGKVLLERDLILKERSGCYFLAKDSELQKKVLEGGIYMLSQAMIHKKGSWKAGWEEMGYRLSKQIPLIGGKMQELYRCSDPVFDVLNHGDLWSSNMMFQIMEYTNFPVSVKFVDFQMPHVGSFIWDINHYMYTSVKPSVRRAFKDDLLTAYHTSLSDNLDFFGYHGVTPTLQDVLGEFDRTLPAGFALVASILAMASGSASEPFRMDKLATESPEDAFDPSIFSEEKYIREICDDLTFFVKKSVV
ncbi:hypothetical protein GE061_017240 [Apolygus lucorum]|uniref:CHK kinase-like domain-containing protein n=1 Tax=Apolygus lucorum TaxID=248454 RepID=A0A8S9XEJ1_APOLU|nr:hypothetical protein GE061_017240 [Apolygus lucorum]